MNPKMTGYTLEKFAEGRYDVFLDNGLRAGSIIGGAGSWQAEAKGQTLTRYNTKDQAAKAILSVLGIVPMYEQMRRVIERPDPLLVAYKNDFFVHDRESLVAWACAVDMIWIVRESGTDLMPLDMPNSKSDIRGMIELRQRAGGPYEVYHVDHGATKLRRITDQQAIVLASREPAWKVHGEPDRYRNVVNGSMIHHGTIVADYSATSDVIYGRGPAGVIVVDCRQDVGAKTLASLRYLAFSAEVKRQGTLFAKVKSLTIKHGKKVLDSWAPPEEKEAA